MTSQSVNFFNWCGVNLVVTLGGREEREEKEGGGGEGGGKGRGGGGRGGGEGGGEGGEEGGGRGGGEGGGGVCSKWIVEVHCACNSHINTWDKLYYPK